MRHKHIDGVEVSEQFSTEGESRYRNRLEIALTGIARSGKTVCAVMQNPSYAGEDVADKSEQFLEEVVFTKGLSEFQAVRRLIVVNQFAYIQTYGFEGLPYQIGQLNDAAIKAALDESDIVVLAGYRGECRVWSEHFGQTYVSNRCTTEVHLAPKQPFPVRSALPPKRDA